MGKCKCPSRWCDTICMDSPGRKCARHGWHYGKSRNTNQCQEQAHTSPTMKMKCFQAPSCSPVAFPPCGFPATRGCSRHLCSATECSRAGTPSVTGPAQASGELHGPQCHQVEWAVMCPFFLKGSCWQGGGKLKLLGFSRPEAVTRARMSHSRTPPRPSPSWSARWAQGAGSYAASSEAAVATSPLSSSGKWSRCQRWPCTDC